MPDLGSTMQRLLPLYWINNRLPDGCNHNQLTAILLRCSSLDSFKILSNKIQKFNKSQPLLNLRKNVCITFQIPIDYPRNSTDKHFQLHPHYRGSSSNDPRQDN